MEPTTEDRTQGSVFAEWSAESH